MATKKQIELIEKLYYSKPQSKNIEDLMLLYMSDGYDNLKRLESEMIINSLKNNQ